MEIGNTRTVFVVQVDNSKDMSEAKQYGQLRAVFETVRKPYDTDKLLSKARFVLQDYQDGDYLLMVGDPTLCAVCMSVALEQAGKINVLSWNRTYFKYDVQVWDFYNDTEQMYMESEV